MKTTCYKNGLHQSINFLFVGHNAKTTNIVYTHSLQKSKSLDTRTIMAKWFVVGFWTLKNIKAVHEHVHSFPLPFVSLHLLPMKSNLHRSVYLGGC